MNEFEATNIPLLFSAHDKRERGVNSERVIPRDALVGAAIRDGYIPHEVRRIRIRRRRAQILPRWRRVSHYTQHMERRWRSEVRFYSSFSPSPIIIWSVAKLLWRDVKRVTVAMHWLVQPYGMLYPVWSTWLYFGYEFWKNQLGLSSPVQQYRTS